MNLQEIDWRLSSTKRILQALTEALKDVGRDFGRAQDEFEIEGVMEHAESLLGIAFVAAQTYMAGTVSDANELIGPGSKRPKEQLLKQHNDTVTESGITKVELCDAMANYFKHHDEWKDWSGPGPNQRTVSILRAAGIDEHDSFPCHKAARVLWPTQDSSDLGSLLALVSGWREAVIAATQR